MDKTVAMQTFHLYWWSSWCNQSCFKGSSTSQLQANTFLDSTGSSRNIMIFVLWYWVVKNLLLIMNLQRSLLNILNNSFLIKSYHQNKCICGKDDTIVEIHSQKDLTAEETSLVSIKDASQFLHAPMHLACLSANCLSLAEVKIPKLLKDNTISCALQRQ